MQTSLVRVFKNDLVFSLDKFTSAHGQGSTEPTSFAHYLSEIGIVDIWLYMVVASDREVFLLLFQNPYGFIKNLHSLGSSLNIANANRYFLFVQVCFRSLPSCVHSISTNLNQSYTVEGQSILIDAPSFMGGS